jgi:hypothetical protein
MIVAFSDISMESEEAMSYNSQNGSACKGDMPMYVFHLLVTNALRADIYTRGLKGQ